MFSYRAKNIKTNEYVEGNLITTMNSNKSKCYSICIDKIDTDYRTRSNAVKIIEDIDFYEIDVDTLSIYLGNKDSNDNKIFVGLNKHSGDRLRATYRTKRFCTEINDYVTSEKVIEYITYFEDGNSCYKKEDSNLYGYMNDLFENVSKVEVI